MRISLKMQQEAASTTGHPPQGARKRKMLLAFLFLVGVIVLAFVCGYYLYGKITQSQSSAVSTPGDTQQVVEAVGNLMLLPNETPTIAVVSDLSKLKDQAFFAHAIQGDIVLMYVHAGRAILYSPTLNKIIEVAPITNNKP